MARLQPLNMPVKLTVMTRSHCAALVSSRPVPEKIAALFTITSSRPWRATVLLISASISPQLPTSVFSNDAAPPDRAMRSRVGSPPSSGSATTSAMTTMAPSAAKLAAMARPMPELAPVTTATFPASKLDDICVNSSGVALPWPLTMPIERLQPDLKLAAALFDSLGRMTRSGRGIVRDSYGAGEQAAHDLMRAVAETMDLEVSIDAIGNLMM